MSPATQTVRHVRTHYVYAVDDWVAEGLRNPPVNTFVNPAAAEFADVRARAIVHAVEDIQNHFAHLKDAIKAGDPL